MRATTYIKNTSKTLREAQERMENVLDYFGYLSCDVELVETKLKEKRKKNGKKKVRRV